MRITYLTYFKVIAVPVLLIVGINLIAVFREVCCVISKKDNAYKGLLVTVCTLGSVLFLFRAQI